MEEEVLQFRTDEAGRRLFFPRGTHLPGRVIPDEAAEQELRRLLRERQTVLWWLRLATLLGIVIVVVCSQILRFLVGGWAAIALAGVLILILAAVILTPFVAWLLWHQGRVNRLVASWPEAPPLHASRWEAVRETQRAILTAGPVWMHAVYMVLSGLFAVGFLAMALLADTPQDRFLGVLGAACFGLGALAFAAIIVLRLVRQ